MHDVGVNFKKIFFCFNFLNFIYASKPTKYEYKQKLETI